MPNLDFFIDVYGKPTHYLIEHLEKLGWYKSTANGAVGFDIVDIKTYYDIIKEDLTVWELETLLIMSKAYAGQINGDKDTKYPLEEDFDLDEFEKIMNFKPKGG